MKKKYFKRSRIKQLKELLETFKIYPDEIQETQFHKNRVNTIDWLLASEEGRATEPIIYLKALLGRSPYTHPKYTYYEINDYQLEIAMLVDYIYHNKISHC